MVRFSHHNGNVGNADHFTAAYIFVFVLPLVALWYVIRWVDETEGAQLPDPAQDALEWKRNYDAAARELAKVAKLLDIERTRKEEAIKVLLKPPGKWPQEVIRILEGK